MVKKAAEIVLADDKKFGTTAAIGTTATSPSPAVIQLPTAAPGKDQTTYLNGRIIRSFNPTDNFPVYVLEAVADKDMPSTVTPLTETFRYDTTIDLVIFTRQKEKIMRFPCVNLFVAEEVLQRIADNVVLEEMQKDGNSDLKQWARQIAMKPWNRMVFFLRMRPEYKPVFFAPKHLSEGILSKSVAIRHERICPKTINEIAMRVDFPAELLI